MFSPHYAKLDNFESHIGIFCETLSIYIPISFKECYEWYKMVRIW